MRRLAIYLCVVLCITFFAISCNPPIEAYASDGWVTKYFDSEWNLTYNKKEAKYYRIAFFNDDRICCDSLSSEYLIDNTKLFEGYYFGEHRDSLHGVCTWFHPNGGLAKKYSYDKGSLHGEQNDYYGDGSLKTQYYIANGSYDKEYISYFPNGNVEEKKQYRNGMLNGEYRKFSRDGSPLKEASYIDDILHGEYIEYYEVGGNVKEKMRYNKGKPTGEHIKYYADGQVQEKRRLINDVLSGAYYEYFPNGLVKISGSYTSGNKTGTWTYYEENGSFSVYQNRTYRSGARCRDGSTSGATGRGACSHHGGVAYWLTTTSMVQVRQGQR